MTIRIRLQQEIDYMKRGDFLKEIFPPIDWKVFVGLLLFGYGVHSFRITQMINAADDIYNLLKGYGVGIPLGRWALEYLGNLIDWRWDIGSFNLSAFDGLIALIFLSLSVCIILEIFGLQHEKKGIFFAALFMAYPTCSATFLFMFTAAYYGLSCLLAVLAAYYLKTHRFLLGLAAIVCIAVSLGLYQAYFPMTVTLCLLMVIDYFLKKDADFKKGIQSGIYYVSVLCLGLIVYYAILNNRLEHFGKTLLSYKGIDSMGELNIREIPGLILKCYTSFLHLTTEQYHSINTLKVMRDGILILFIANVIMVVCSMFRRTKWRSRIMILLTVFLFPVAVNLIEIMCPEGGIYELTIYATVFVFLLPIVLWKNIDVENGVRQVLHRALGLIIVLDLALMTVGYGWHANLNYVALDYMNRETESYFTTLVTRIKSAEGYHDEYQVLFAGDGLISDAHFQNPYSDYAGYLFECNPLSLVSGYAWRKALTAYTGFFYAAPSQDEMEIIYGTEEFRGMSVYPDDGSIRVIDEVIVIKISE